MKRIISVVALIFVGIAFDAAADTVRETPRTNPWQAPAATPKGAERDMPRAQLLYENHCRGCHESVVHVRDKRKATSLAAVEAWVRRWAGEQKLGWDNEEVTAVARYLNDRFYKFKPAAP